MIARRTLLAAPAALLAAPQPNVLVIPLPDKPLLFPPIGRAYRENGESFRIWRGVLEAAPDLVVTFGRDAANLEAALKNVGIPAQVVSSEVEARRQAGKKAPKSAANQDMERRLERSPRDLATQLSTQYGQRLENVVYIEAFALWGRLRLGDRNHVAGLLEPFLSGQRNPLAKPTASHYSGHLLVADFAKRAGDRRAVELVQAAARRAVEQPLDNEMSDSVFMVCPLLAAADSLSSDPAFLRAAAAHFDRMEKLCRRDDGIWRHSPLCDAAWGRGNAFPLFGLALTLSELKTGDESFPRFLKAYQTLAERLVSHQNAKGLWHQVIDRSDSYAEYSATAMITLALERGMRRGWLPRSKYSKPVKLAWTAINRRTSLSGELMDVCESTGKQDSVEAYLNREAIFGRDPRGGAMALMVSTELAGLA